MAGALSHGAPFGAGRDLGALLWERSTS